MARRNPDESVDRAVGVIQKDYYADVNSWAEEFDKRIADGEWDDRDDFIESLEQEVDGAQRVIYTFRAKLGLLVSDNADYGIDELGAEFFDWSSGIPYSQLMYFAFRQDIIEAMESDIDDDETFDPEDEDEDDED